MITIKNQPPDDSLNKGYPPMSLERQILDTLISSSTIYNYNSIDQLKFELRMRREIINAAEALFRSGMSFAVFRKSECNPVYWQRMDDGGFALRPGIKASDAIRDIFKNGDKYATECATAMVIIYYKALLEIFPEDIYNEMFPNIYLMDWSQIARELREIGWMQPAKDYLPGDRRYFDNPEVDPITPEWQGENVIDMDNGIYYGHGIGKHKADTFIKALNRRRKKDAEISAYLMDSAGRPNFKRLFDLYKKSSITTSSQYASA